MGAFLDFQKAVFAALNGSPELTALIGAGRVFDDVPNEKEPGWVFDKDHPYVVIGNQSGEENGADDVDAADMSTEVLAHSRGAGKAQVLSMLDTIRVALHGKSHAVANGVIVVLLYASHETLPSADRETFSGVIRFTGFYQFG